MSTTSTAPPEADSVTNGESISGLPSQCKFIDIGINLSDPVFNGVYHGKRAHEDDLKDILGRARRYNVEKLVITGSDLKESQRAVDLARDHPNICYATVGVHPCSAKAFLSDKNLLASLRRLILLAAREGQCVAIGEIGLDYDRLFLTDKETQLRFFEAQLDLAVELHQGLSKDDNSSSTETTITSKVADVDNLLAKPLPLFLHSRAAHEDFLRLLKPRLAHLPAGGVVHSFTGTAQELAELIDAGLEIGINGCSLKTAENLDIVRAVPLERLHLETDGPWCEIRASSAGAALLGGLGTGLFRSPKSVKKEKWSHDAMVKGRNEPCMIGLVAEVVAKAKGVDVAEVAEVAWQNSIRTFGLQV